MNKMFILIIVLLVFSVVGCGSENSGMVESLKATNQALIIQATVQSAVNETQNAIIPTRINIIQQVATPTEQSLSFSNTSTPPITPAPSLTNASPTGTPTSVLEDKSPEKISFGTGPGLFKSNNYYGVYNLHILNNGYPFSLDDRQLWNSANGNEFWWDYYRYPIAIGNHKVGQIPSGKNWELWSVGSPPIKISGNGNSKYLFINNSDSVYSINFNVISGAFQLQISCADFMNDEIKGSFVKIYDHDFLQSGNDQANLPVGLCELSVGLKSSGDIEWELNLMKQS
jgi:hypothetical protein